MRNTCARPQYERTRVTAFGYTPGSVVGPSLDSHVITIVILRIMTSISVGNHVNPSIASIGTIVMIKIAIHIIVSNGSAATVWIKPLPIVAMSGMGVAISSLGSMFFPITGIPEGGIYIETAASIIAIGFR